MKLRHAFAIALLAAPAFAVAAPAPATDTMQVALNLENSCTIAIDDLNFGVHSTLAANIDSQMQMRVRCTGISSSMGIAISPGGSGNGNARRMTDGNGNNLNYQIYLSPNGVNPYPSLWTFFGFGQNITWTLHGRVFAGQNPKPAGSYSDTLVATVSF